MEKTFKTIETVRLPDATRVGFVHLRVHDLEQALRLYRDLLGFREIGRSDTSVSLGTQAASRPILVLIEEKKAQPRSRTTPGLFHVAVLYKNRTELARVLRRLAESEYPFQGFADHGVSEALYLADSEGNGIELYADRPRDTWKSSSGSVKMVSEPLDIDDLLRELKSVNDPWNGVHPDTKIGHIHLQVSDLTKADKFYHETLGFDVTQRSYPGALFLSAGGYHHHIGVNVWNSKDSSPAPGNATGLIRFAVEVPDMGTVHRLKDRLDDFNHPNELSGDGRSLTTRDFDNIEITIGTYEE